MSTPHNQAQKGEIAKTVLMPGDPLRAKFLAEHYLEDVHQFNAVRNMFGYTGFYHGKKVSNFAHQFELPGTYSAISSYDLLEKAVEQAKLKGASYHVGNVIASDIFYHADQDSGKKWASMGCLGVEMESYALFATAAYLGKKALTLLTVSDSLVTQEETTAQEREQTFTTMMEIALEIA